MFFQSDEVRVKDEILQRIQTEHKQMLKSLSVMLSKPTHYVDTIETAIKTRIFEILNENRDKEAVCKQNSTIFIKRIDFICILGN